MGIFSSDTLFTAREMRGVRPQDSVAFRKLFSDKRIADVLDQKVERMAVWKRMKEEAAKTQDGRLTRDGMRRVLGSLRRGEEASINIWKEAIPLAHEILPGRFTKRYLGKERERGERFSSKISPVSGDRGSAPGSVGGTPRFTPPKSSPRGAPISPRF